MTKRLLISEATSYKAVVLAAFVKRFHPGVAVYTCDWRAPSRILHTRHSDRHFVLRHRVEDGTAYKDEVLGLVREHAIDVFIPIHSGEMDLLLAARDEFGQALGYWGDYEAFRSLNEKDRLQELGEQCGVRMPERYRDAASARLPVVVKPARSSAAKEVRYFEDRALLEAFLAGRHDAGGYLIQERVPGEGVGYSVFAVAGEIVVGYGHRRLAEYPVTGGSSVYREPFDDGRMAERARRILERTRWSGFAMFEFKRARNGDLTLLEVNPRVWGSINQGLQGGADFLRTLLGPAATAAPAAAVRTYFSPLVYLSLALYAARGNFGPACTFVSKLRSNRADIGLFQDPRAWLGSFLRLR